MTVRFCRMSNTRTQTIRIFGSLISCSLRIFSPRLPCSSHEDIVKARDAAFFQFGMPRLIAREDRDAQFFFVELDQLGAVQFQVSAHGPQSIRQPVKVGKLIGLGAIGASLMLELVEIGAGEAERVVDAFTARALLPLAQRREQ